MKKAFTLAETLITLMIIGVVAVMTIPALKDHSDESKYVAAAKKAYASVTAAATAVEARHTDMAFWDCSTKTRGWFKEVLNTVEPAGKTTWEHHGLGGTAVYNNGASMTVDFFTADGMSWKIGGGNGKCTILMDTNGEQPPNVTGIDQVAFQVGRSDNGVDYGVYPKGTANHASDQGWCTSYIIEHGKMPWLRDPSKAVCASYY